MEGIFLKLLNMSIAASWLVLAIVVIRLLFKKAPKVIWCILWALVGIRLLFPFSVESVLSMIPSAEMVPQDIVFPHTPAIQSGLPMAAGESANSMQVIVFIASVIWVVGMVVMLLYTLISYLHLHRKVQEAVEWKDNIWLCDRIATPFILGILRPKIFLPASMQEMDMEYVIAHEKAHLKRRDHWWKPLGFALLSVYWFNPAMWVAYILLCRDIELACDEKVIQTLGMESKKPYSAALINCSVPRRMLAACPLAFGEVGIKERVKSVLHYRKPAFWVTIVAVIICITVAACFLTNPQSEQNSDLKGLSVEIVSMELSGPAPYIEVKWRNHTFEELTCGEAFYIYREQNGDWEDCRITEEYIVHTTGYSIPIMGTFQKKYYLYDLNLSEPGKYRFESSCSTSHDAAGGLQTYHVWNEFELQEGMLAIASRQFKAS